MKTVIVVGGEQKKNELRLFPRLERVGLHVQRSYAYKRARNERIGGIAIPPNVDAVLALTDVMSHQIFHNTKQEADRRGVKFLAVSKDWSKLQQSLVKAGLVTQEAIDNLIIPQEEKEEMPQYKPQYSTSKPKCITDLEEKKLKRKEFAKESYKQGITIYRDLNKHMKANGLGGLNPLLWDTFRGELGVIKFDINKKYGCNNRRGKGKKKLEKQQLLTVTAVSHQNHPTHTASTVKEQLIQHVTRIREIMLKSGDILDITIPLKGPFAVTREKLEVIQTKEAWE